MELAAPLLGFLGVVVVAAISAFATLTIGKRNAQHQRETNQFSQSFELQKYIDERIDKAVEAKTQHLEKQLSTFKKILRNVWNDFDTLRDWGIAFLAQVRTQWGQTSTPPEVEQKILDLLHADDTFDSTLTREEARDFLNDERASR